VPRFVHIASRSKYRHEPLNAVVPDHLYTAARALFNFEARSGHVGTTRIVLKYSETQSILLNNFMYNKWRKLVGNFCRFVFSSIKGGVQRPCAMKKYGGTEVKFHGIVTSALDAGEWSASFFSRFNTRKIVSYTRWIGGWVVSRRLKEKNTYWESKSGLPASSIWNGKKKIRTAS